MISKWLIPASNITAIVPPKVHFLNNLHFNADNLRKYVGDNEEFLKELVSMAKTDLSNALPELSKSIKNQEITEIKNIAHKMKGTALSACFDILTVYLRQLESIDDYAHNEVADAAKGIREEIEYLNTL